MMKRRVSRGALLALLAAAALAAAGLAGIASAHRDPKPDVTLKTVVGVWDGLLGEHAVARLEIESPTSGCLWIGSLGGAVRYFDLVNITSRDRALVLRFVKSDPREEVTIRARGNADSIEGGISVEIVYDGVMMGGGPFELMKSDGRSFLGRVADTVKEIEADSAKRASRQPGRSDRKGAPIQSPELRL